ncbi:hypothetical protein MMC18_002617 [Xylographa bjoerkii]|nr:hypothetical protein [Xylographa bjoerkii]
MAKLYQSTLSFLGAADPVVPVFILNYREWKIQKYVDVANDVQKEGGYGIISYAWGKWHDQSKWMLPGSPGYPAFDLGVDAANKPLPGWVFPVLHKLKTENLRVFLTEEILTITDFRKALASLGTKYVWWDWAGIPQGLDKPKDPKQIVQSNIPYYVPEVWEDIKGQEVNKMRLIYPRSLRGCLWWHQTEWSRGNKVTSPVEELLDCIEAMAISKTPLTISMVNNYVTALEKARNWEMSLQSLWSFQEGVLFGHAKRILDKSPTRLDGQRLLPSVLLDRYGRPQGPKVSGDNQRPPFQYGQADLADIFTTTSTIASAIAGALVATNKAKVSDFEGWCMDAKNEGEARKMLSELIRSGMVGYTYDNPLPLLEARFGRTWMPWNQDVDVSVNALIGALSVDIGETGKEARGIKEIKTAESLSEAIQQLQKTGTKAPTEAQLGPAKAVAKAAGEAAELALMKSVFIDTLFKIYQWRMLLLARGSPTINRGGTGFWVTLIGRDRPQFASLEAYLGSDKLSQVYGPDIQRNPAQPVGMITNLPQLDIPNGAMKATLTLKANHQYIACRFKDQKTSPPGWTKCIFYSYVASNDPTLGGTVKAVEIPFAKHQDSFGSSTDTLVLPIENVDHHSAPAQENVISKLQSKISRFVLGAPDSIKNPTRCAILTQYDPNDSIALFWGIGDFEGFSKDALSFHPDKDIGIY